MHESILFKYIIQIIVLLFVAVVSKIFFRKINFPYTIGLVMAGIFIQYIYRKIYSFEDIGLSISHDLIMYVLLPILIFEAAINIDFKLLLKNLSPILVLAGPGLILSTIIVGVFLGHLTPLGLHAALLFGALISATDPVAVVQIFNSIGAPNRLKILVDGESLFNDATAIVTFQIIFTIIASGTALSWAVIGKGAVEFVVVFLGGILVGVLVAYPLLKLSFLLDDDPILYVAGSIVVAYVSFILADHFLKVSGVMAAVGAGIVGSWYSSHYFTPRVRESLEGFWTFAAFLANSFLFLFVGNFSEYLLADLEKYRGLAFYIFLAIVAVIISRLAVIYGICPLFGLRKKEEKIGLPHRHVMFWGGLRGGVALALSFSLPPDFEHKYLIIGLTLGVVLFTLFVQGTTIKKLMDFLGIEEEMNSKKDLPTTEKKIQNNGGS